MELPTKLTIEGNYNKITTESNDLEIKFYKDGNYLLKIRDGKIKQLETIIISDKKKKAGVRLRTLVTR